MKQVHGDLIGMAIKGDFDVIIHGCNCHCNMGAGIARSIKRAFPQAYWADCKTKPGKRSKVGTISYTDPIGGLVIVNAYTQYDYGRGKRQVNYGAVRSCFREIKELFAGKRIGYPLIGAGLAGGDWNKISQIIDEELEGEDHTVVIYQDSAHQSG